MTVADAGPPKRWRPSGKEPPATLLGVTPHDGPFPHNGTSKETPKAIDYSPP